MRYNNLNLGLVGYDAIKPRKEEFVAPPMRSRDDTGIQFNSGGFNLGSMGAQHFNAKSEGMTRLPPIGYAPNVVRYAFVDSAHFPEKRYDIIEGLVKDKIIAQYGQNTWSQYAHELPAYIEALVDEGMRAPAPGKPYSAEPCRSGNAQSVFRSFPTEGGFRKMACEDWYGSNDRFANHVLQMIVWNVFTRPPQPVPVVDESTGTVVDTSDLTGQMDWTPPKPTKKYLLIGIPVALLGIGAIVASIIFATKKKKGGKKK